MTNPATVDKRSLRRVHGVAKAGLILAVALVAFPASAAEPARSVGPVTGDREFTLSGTGSSDRDFDNSSFGISADLGWYYSERTLIGVRQSVSYADIEGESISDDFWNGATRGFVDYHFGGAYWRPFLGASLGVVYGDGISDSAFGGLEVGMKYYVLEKTFLMGRAEYQWFFDSSSDARDNFDDGAWAYTIGMGYNF
jgi:hypothetical protein